MVGGCVYYGTRGQCGWDCPIFVDGNCDIAHRDPEPWIERFQEMSEEEQQEYEDVAALYETLEGPDKYFKTPDPRGKNKW